MTKTCLGKWKKKYLQRSSNRQVKGKQNKRAAEKINIFGVYNVPKITGQKNPPNVMKT